MVLAIGLATAINLLMAAVMWDAVRSDTPGLSENATQVIIAGFAGIGGILGGYIGARAVERGQQLERNRGPVETPERGPADRSSPD